MSKKLIGALVAGSLLVLPVSGAQAKSSGHPVGPAKERSSVPDPCLGNTAQWGNTCQGHTYTYVCVPPLYPKQLAVFTNSDATEDYYEAPYWRCRGD